MWLRNAVTLKFFLSDISNSHYAFRLYTGDRMGLSSDTLTHSFFSVPLCPTFLMCSESITPWLCIFCLLLFPCVHFFSIDFHVWRVKFNLYLYHQIHFDPLTHLQPNFCLAQLLSTPPFPSAQPLPWFFLTPLLLGSASCYTLLWGSSAAG